MELVVVLHTSAEQEVIVQLMCLGLTGTNIYMVCDNIMISYRFYKMK